jgi:hypothetical protein
VGDTKESHVIVNTGLYEYVIRASPTRQATLEMLWYDIQKFVYYYGDHFKEPHSGKTLGAWLKWMAKRCWINGRFIRSFVRKSTGEGASKPLVMSNGYFGLQAKLEELGYDVVPPLWHAHGHRVLRPNLEIFSGWRKISGLLEKGTFAEVVSDDFLDFIEDYAENLSGLYSRNDLRAVLMPFDLPFFERLNIEAFKRIGRPSFVFLHGLPGRYNSIDDNRANYLIVWGEKIRQNYINAGVEASKIFVSGHPLYQHIKPEKLLFGLGNILVITKTVAGVPASSGEAAIHDRGRLIVYLLTLRNVLESFGIRHVRFRPHPSESISWYRRFVGNDFFIEDSRNLATALKDSSLVIGPASTVFLESIYHGRDYLVYEPSENSVDIMGYPVAPPFDGSDRRIPVAKSEDDLAHFIKTRTSVDPAVFGDYIKSPFDISFLTKLIG